MSPIDMVLHCPKCGMQHVDAPDETREIRGGELCVETWDNPPHRSHKCKACGCIWRPADVPTNGVKAVATRGKADTWPAGVKAASNEVAAKAASNEVVAKAIYEQWKDLPGWTPWVEGGNSLKQGEARALAREHGGSAVFVDGVPAFDTSQACSLRTMRPGQVVPTMCPRCKNPHHGCDQGVPVLDHANSNLAPATATSSLDHEQVKQKFLRGELGSTEMPAAQIWDAPGVTPCRRCGADEPRTGTCSGDGLLCAPGVAAAAPAQRWQRRQRRGGDGIASGLVWGEWRDCTAAEGADALNHGDPWDARCIPTGGPIPDAQAKP